MRSNDTEACMAHIDQLADHKKLKSSFVDLAGSRKAAKLVTSRWLWYMNISISMLATGAAIGLEMEPSSERNWEMMDSPPRSARIFSTNSGSFVLISTGSCALMNLMTSACIWRLRKRRLHSGDKGACPFAVDWVVEKVRRLSYIRSRIVVGMVLNEVAVMAQ